MPGQPRPIAMVAALLLLGACTTSEYGPKEAGGTLIGGGLGGLAGSHIGSGDTRLIATGAGTLIGAFLGNAAGRSLDRADRLYAAEAGFQALEYTPSGDHVAWRNPDSGNHGAVIPEPAYRAPSGQHCREYSHNATIDGYVERVHGTACRDAYGTWRAAN